MKKIILIISIFSIFFGIAGFVKAAVTDSCWSAEKLKTINCSVIQGNCDLAKDICQRHCGTWLRIGLPGFIQNCVPNGVPPIDEADLTKGYDFSHSGFMVIFTGIYKLGLALLAIVTLFMIVWGGYQYLTAMGGNRASEGKKIIYYAIGGMILGLSSWLILNVINDQLIKGYSNPLRFQSEIEQAKRRIENDSKKEVCGQESEVECKGKNVENLCQKSGSINYGICKADANIAGNLCSCVESATCSDSTCNGGDQGCVGQTCLLGSFAGGDARPGQCVLPSPPAQQVVTCVDSAASCSADCGAAANGTGPDCFGQSCNGGTGVCDFSNSQDYWYACKDKAEACNLNCGANFDNPELCKGVACNASGAPGDVTGKCLNNNCLRWLQN